MQLMVKFGKACKAYMDTQLQGLILEHVEVDEVWTFVQKKQGRLTPEEKAERCDVGDVYLWTCLDKVNVNGVRAHFVISKATRTTATVDLAEAMLPCRLTHWQDRRCFRVAGFWLEIGPPRGVYLGLGMVSLRAGHARPEIIAEHGKTFLGESPSPWPGRAATKRRASPPAKLCYHDPVRQTRRFTSNPMH